LGLRLHILAVGKLRGEAMSSAAQTYQTRLTRYAEINIVEVRESRKVEGKGTSKAVAAEGDALLGAVPKGAWVVALDERGKHLSSREFAGRLQARMVGGDSRIAFLVGGALGLSDAVRQRADMTLALSRMTLPHELARVVLLEQLYRAMTILRGEPYHK
jgi:23S rRNA (pseudouridine1915-N3)-methyltransferase